MEPSPGLRERKKQRTRETIVEAAFDLFDEHGFEGTTVADIAEAAEIAPRTFFAYFPSKDDVVFHDFEDRYAMVSGWLQDREPGVNAIDALRAGFTEKMRDAPVTHLQEKRLRKQLIRESESLAAHSEYLNGKFAELLAEAVAEDLGDSPDGLRPRMVAAATSAAMGVIEDLPEDDATLAAETIDSLLTFLRGGLTALQAQSAA